MSYNLLGLYTPIRFAVGTGIIHVIDKAQTQFRDFGGLPDVVVQTMLGYLPTLFGDYPRVEQDRAACLVFIIAFSLLAVANIYIWLRNLIAGQVFHISLGLSFFCICSAIGFGLRIGWALDIVNIDIGISSVVFTQVPVLMVKVFTVILAHRIFSWRHPATGYSNAFLLSMFFTCFLVCSIVAVAIIGQAVPYLYYLTPTALESYQRMVKAVAIIEILYCMVPTMLIILAYLLKPGTIDHRVWRRPSELQSKDMPIVLQPTWIKHFGLLYFPKKVSHLDIDLDEWSGALRVIPSCETPAGGKVKTLTPPMPNAPCMSSNVAIVLITSMSLCWSACLRAVSTFQTGIQGGVISGDTVIPLTFWVDHNYVFYLWYGALELTVVVLLLVMRIDLRFYIPDRTPKNDKKWLSILFRIGTPFYRHFRPN